MALECRYETYRWILGDCWLPLTVSTLVLAAFDRGELLAIDITTILPLVFIISLDFPGLCNDYIKSEHAHNRHTRGGGGEKHVKLLHHYN